MIFQLERRALRESTKTHNTFFFDIAEHGGHPGVCDRGALDAALALPRNRRAFAESGEVYLAALAAAYAFGISTGHPFVDGNKRTSFVVTRTFLLLNSADLEAAPAEKFREFLAKGKVSEDELSAWIRSHLVTIE